jgi:hypothetical protein
MQQRTLGELCLVTHTWNPSTQKAKAEGSQVQDQYGLQNKTLSQKKKKNLEEKNIKQ